MTPAHVFYFSPGGTCEPIGCAALAQYLRGRLPEEPGGLEDPRGDPALWAEIAKLQWSLRADGLIDDHLTQRRIADLNLRAVAAALFSRYTARHPHMLAHTRDTVIQVIALGEHMATSVAESADLMAYVKNEMQPIPLATYLLD